MSMEHLDGAEQPPQDPGAGFEEIYRRYYPAIMHYVFCRTGNSALAEELAAEVFVRLIHRMDRFAGSQRSLRAWLYVVARNLVIDHRRRARRLTWLPLDNNLKAGDSGCPPLLAEHKLIRDGIDSALRRLTALQRQVILLKFREGYSNAEVGKILGRDENSIKSLQHRALVTLRHSLDQDLYV